MKSCVKPVKQTRTFASFSIYKVYHLAEVVNKFEAGSDDVNGLILLGTDGETLGDHSTGETGVITVSSDRSVRIWLLRDSGQVWEIEVLQ